jgi:hypothetical protein
MEWPMKIDASTVPRLLALCLVGLMPSVAIAWQYTLTGPGFSDDRFVAVSLDKQGDVYAAGWAGTITCPRSFTVVKVSGETGKSVWIREFCGSTTQGNALANGARWVASDSRGDVLASGAIEESGGNAGTIVKLAGATGAGMWRATPAPEVALLAMDPNGDLAVEATGSCPGGQNPPDSIMKLSGADGSILWCKGITTAGEASGRIRDLVADPSGDFIAVGSTRRTSTNSFSLAAVRLAGTNGNEIWRYESDGQDADHVALDPAGGVILAGRRVLDFKVFVAKLEGISGKLQWATDPGALTSTGVRSIAAVESGDVLVGGVYSSNPISVHTDFIVEKVSGGDGSALWHQLLVGPSCGNAANCNGQANVVALDPAGDAVGAGGAFSQPASDLPFFAVVRFSGETGDLLWSRFLNSLGIASAMTITPDGNVVAAGDFVNPSSGVDAVIVKLDGRTGADYLPSPLRMLEALLMELRSLGLPSGVERSLEAKLVATKRILETGSLPEGASENLLAGFIHEVDALSGKKMDAAEADGLVAAAQEIIDLLNPS